MTQRITEAHLRSKCDTINSMLGIEDAGFLTLGAVRLEMAYGGTGVSRIMNESGGITTLCDLGTKREVSHFLNGMIQSLRILDDEKKKA